jgi:3-hydroxybutyryl-CoA dehydrogenase
MIVGIIGSGAMGAGIAQVALIAGHQVIMHDSNASALTRASNVIEVNLQKQVDKGKLSPSDMQKAMANLINETAIRKLSNCQLIIEAIIEDVEIKKEVFKLLDQITSPETVIATNTSSLSVTQLAAACSKPHRFIGIHFFNPAHIMPLVEIIPGVRTAKEVTQNATEWIQSWGKNTVVAKDTPGFIVNRIARPFYSEAIRIYEEGIATFETIDAAMTQIGGFKMGPFTLMDFIGHDVNYRVTESVWNASYFEPRFKPSQTQKALLDAGFLGQKSGKGFYEYGLDATNAAPNADPAQQQAIFLRIIAQLINEAADAAFWGIASEADIEIAMTKGVNYPKGLLAWAKELGYSTIVTELDRLYNFYHEERYRCSPWLRNKIIS